MKCSAIFAAPGLTIGRTSKDLAQNGAPAPREAAEFLSYMAARDTRPFGLLRNSRKTGRPRRGKLRSSCRIWRRGIRAPLGFCPTCGKAAGVTPLMPVESRIGGHVRLWGILWLALSAFHLIPGLILLSFSGHGAWSLPLDAPNFVHLILRMAGWVLLTGSILGLVTGWGLLQREPWARTMAILLACLNLVHMPFGTILGIYTLWVLLPAASEQEYRSVARAA